MLLACALSLFSLAEVHSQNKLPDFVRWCENGADTSECVKQALNDLRPHLMKGIPEFRLPPIDPLHVSRINFALGNSTIVNYHADLTNLAWTGTGDFEVVEAFADARELVLRLTLRFPRLLLTGQAYVNGTMLSFKIEDVGTAEVTFTNVIISIVLNGERFISKEREFIKWETEDVEITYDDVYYSEMQGFFYDPAITRLFQLAINKGARLLGTTFRMLLSSISNFIIEAVNQVHAMYPSNVLYL